ncbi:Dehydrogenase/reductase SDR family member 11 [Camponotus floridanus]|uniref:Dehydrogenase/reductase SDR family member 11 n=1 Tax=Camponotus floridanus TaxID=104421 RepID=E2A6D8_CAMFO|nr:Dehydrogenase/reductase SDR family member 11 [Camponotus floridanus]
MSRWANKTAIVIGAGSDLGQAITFALLKDGIHVTATHIKEEKMDELKTTYENMDKKDTLMGKLELKYNINDIEESFKKDVDILVNNLNIFSMGLSLYDQFINDAIESMRRRQVEGHIFNINSAYGHFLPKKSLNDLGQESTCLFNQYVAAEHANVALTHMVRLRVEGVKPPIRVTSISPSCLRTDISLELPLLYDFMGPEDVADTIIYALTLKPEIEITELIIQPTGTLP